MASTTTSRVPAGGESASPAVVAAATAAVTAAATAAGAAATAAGATTAAVGALSPLLSAMAAAASPGSAGGGGSGRGRGRGGAGAGGSSSCSGSGGVAGAPGGVVASPRSRDFESDWRALSEALLRCLSPPAAPAGTDGLVADVGVNGGSGNSGGTGGGTPSTHGTPPPVPFIDLYSRVYRMVLADGAGAELHARLRLLFAMHARGVASVLARGRVPPLAAVPPPAPPPPVAVPADGLSRARRHAAAAAAVAALDADESEGESDGDGERGGDGSRGCDSEGDTLDREGDGAGAGVGSGSGGRRLYGRPYGPGRVGVALSLGFSPLSSSPLAAVVGDRASASSSPPSSRSSSPTGATAPARAACPSSPALPLSPVEAALATGLVVASSPVTPHHAPQPSPLGDAGRARRMPPQALSSGALGASSGGGGSVAPTVAHDGLRSWPSVAAATPPPAPPSAAATAAAAAAGVARANADAARLLYAYRAFWLAYAAGVDTAAAIFGFLDRAWSSERTVGGPLAARSADVMDVRSMALLAWRQQLFGSVGGALVDAALTVIGASRARRAAALDERMDTTAGRGSGGLLRCPDPNADGLCGCADKACAERSIPPPDWLPSTVPGLDAMSDFLVSLVVMGPAGSAVAAADGASGARSAMLPLLSRLQAVSLRDPNVAVLRASSPPASGSSPATAGGAAVASKASSATPSSLPPGLPIEVGDMELYRSAFERKFLDASAEYYAAEADRLLDRLPSPVTYVWAVEAAVRPAELAASVGVYAAAETLPRLAVALDAALVGAHAPRLTGLVPALLLDGRSADLRILHRLLMRLPAGSLRPLQDCLRGVVHMAGTAAVAPHLPGGEPSPQPLAVAAGASRDSCALASPECSGEVYHDAVGPEVVHQSEDDAVALRATAFVNAAWGVYERYAGVVSAAFGADPAFTDALDRGCARFLNAADSASPVTLALYCHAVLSGAGDAGGIRGVGGSAMPWAGHTGSGGGGVTASAVDPDDEAARVRCRLACVTRLFRFLDDKAAFLSEYASCLARRLVAASVTVVAADGADAPANGGGVGGWRVEAERVMLEDLRDTVGPAYTSPLARMLADLDCSREENVSFACSRRRGPAAGSDGVAKPGIDVLVLTAGAWPLPPHPPPTFHVGGGYGAGSGGGGGGGVDRVGDVFADAPFSSRARAHRALCAAVTAVHPDASATLLPRDVQDASAAWAGYYLTVHAGRRLTWLPALASVEVAWARDAVAGNGDVAATAIGYDAGPGQTTMLTTTPAQAAVLLLFNAASSLSAAAIEAGAPRVPRAVAVAHSLVSRGVLVVEQTRTPTDSGSSGPAATGPVFSVASVVPSTSAPMSHWSTVPAQHLPLALMSPYVLATGGLGGDPWSSSGADVSTGGGGDDAAWRSSGGGSAGAGRSGAGYRSGNDDARMRVQAAVACAAKAGRRLSRAALTAAVRAALAPRFPVTDAAVGRAVEALVERELLAVTPVSGGSAGGGSACGGSGSGGGNDSSGAIGCDEDIVEYVL
ncbi:hypothetical protein MMPV_000878 [Pyropia vietnamensis]